MAKRRRSTSALAALLTAALLGLAALAPAAALADGDPASDVLLGENVFYPYSPAASKPVQQTLNGVTAAAKRAGFPIKVALIASPVDLGVIPDLFNEPQKYAAFLDQEISFRAKQPLLVVMPAGYGAQGLNAKSTSTLSTLAKPASGTGNALATAASSAVTKLAEASGHPISGSSGASKSSSSGSGATILIVLAAAALITAAALAVITMRRRSAGAAG